jgi:hypothetical protein
MPSFSRSLDVYQGFNFKKDKQSKVGFITEMTLGDDEPLVADQTTIMDPENPTTELGEGVVAVLSHYMWETGVTDAMYLSGQISEKNKQVLSMKLLNNWTNMEVKFSYRIYEYDPVAKKYFLSNKGEDLQGILEKNGEDLNLSVADEESREVQSPKNYTMQVGIKPYTKEQLVDLATAHTKNISKKWGITAAE